MLLWGASASELAWEAAPEGGEGWTWGAPKEVFH